jgi:hypothetical protein
MTLVVQPQLGYDQAKRLFMVELARWCGFKKVFSQMGFGAQRREPL